MFSATDYAIAQAVALRTIRVTAKAGRFGSYWIIEDEHGVIEVALSEDEARDRIKKVAELLALAKRPTPYVV